jgi:hypothetical protein
MSVVHHIDALLAGDLIPESAKLSQPKLSLETLKLLDTEILDLLEEEEACISAGDRAS